MLSSNTRLIIKDRTSRQPFSQTSSNTGAPTHEPWTPSTSRDVDLAYGRQQPPLGQAADVTGDDAVVGASSGSDSGAHGPSSGEVKQLHGGPATEHFKHLIMAARQLEAGGQLPLVAWMPRVEVQRRQDDLVDQ